MDNHFNEIQYLLRSKAELQARLNLIPYEGTIEIKDIDNKKYLYVRKRLANKVKSIYVGVYSEELYTILLKQVKDAKDIKKKIREIEKDLAKLGYSQEEISNNVILNLDFAKTKSSFVMVTTVSQSLAITFSIG